MLRMALCIVICLAFPMGFSQEAHADYSIAWFVEYPSPKEIRAIGNGQRFSRIDPAGDMNAVIQVRADAGMFGRVTEVGAHLHLQNLDFDTQDLVGKLWGYHKSYKDLRRKSINSTIPVRIPANELQRWMTEQCNALVNKLDSEGLTNREIWGRDRTIRIEAGRSFGVGFRGPSGIKSKEVLPDSHNVTLICQKFEGAQAPGIEGVRTPRRPPGQAKKRVVRVESAKLKHSVKVGKKGVCKLHLSYTVRTNHKKAIVKFRLKDNDGRSSEIKTLVTNDRRLAAGAIAYPIPKKGKGRKGKIWMQGVSPQFKSNTIQYRKACRTPAQREQLRQNRSSQGRQRIGGGVRSRGIPSLPPLVIPDPEPPALPNLNP